ncbi:hypothetical protein R3P38DRAFT_3195150 [Favolaschia claudopus]|uniref:DUF7330 domain-containing protein n=1 Tax=Favolaschia claudopus TaxID=2862362 RepID=A0AAW0BBZ2_9AGAR
MLLPSPKVVEETNIAVNAAIIPNEPPPAYVHEASTSGTNALQQSARPTNFLSLIRANAPITGSFIIDPNVRVPEALLPDTIEPRRNLYLETAGAPIDVDIFVVGENTSANVRVDIHLQANGPITARIHVSPSIPRPHIRLTASSSAPISIAVPASFRGPLTTRSSRPSPSPSLPPQATIFSEADNTRRGFIGDFADWTRDPVGDEMDLESTLATVSISVMEPEGEQQQRENANTSGPTDRLAWPWSLQATQLQNWLRRNTHYHPLHFGAEIFHPAPFQPVLPRLHLGRGQEARVGSGGRGLRPGLGRGNGGEEQRGQDPLAWIHHARGRGRGGRGGRGFG